MYRFMDDKLNVLLEKDFESLDAAKNQAFLLFGSKEDAYLYVNVHKLPNGPSYRVDKTGFKKLP